MKSLLKKMLFWASFVPLVIPMIALDIIARISDDYDKILHKYERWCFDDDTIL